MSRSPRHARGRHHKPPPEFTLRCDRLLRTALEEHNRRRLVVAGAGTASAGLLAVGALVVLSATAPGEPSRAAAAARAQHAHRSVLPVVDDPGAVPDAVAFLRSRDPRSRVVRHVRQISQSGPYLRVYTDLGEADANSAPAVSLCEWTAQYLRDLGADRPIVFVHARRNDNGHVVLANKQSADDDCTVGSTPR